MDQHYWMDLNEKMVRRSYRWGFQHREPTVTLQKEDDGMFNRRVRYQVIGDKTIVHNVDRHGNGL